MSSTNPQNVTTEWDDLQVEHGNFAAPAEKITEASLTQIVMDFAEEQDHLEGLTLKQLDKLEDDVEEDTLEVYRKRRLAEIMAKKAAYKFGKMYEISKSEYTTAVTDASEDNWVVCVLYSPKQKQSQMMMKVLPHVAAKFGDVKFVWGEVSGILEKFPESNCPTVLLYHKKHCIKQLMGLGPWGNDKISADTVEWRLSRFGIVETKLEVDPANDEHDYNRRRHKGSRYDHKELYGDQRNQMQAYSSEESDDSVSCSDDRDDRGYMSTQIKGRQDRYKL